MPDLAREFEDAATKRMEADGFILFSRRFGLNRDDVILTYCKMNNPKCCAVMASGLDLLRAENVAALGAYRAEIAIKYYNSGSK